ncbi:MAG: phosphate ABC transporter permease PstA [Victivallales bacterium]|jgi:phosphate transport system permease protein|nr:phosphate ABC transporter permease PstA [Victivallales bacterium]
MKKRGIFLRKAKDGLIRIFSAMTILLAIGVMVWILYTVICKGAAIMSFGFLTHASKPFGIAAGGVANAILGSLLITLGAAIIAIPPAVCAGIYLAEFSTYPKLSGVLRFCANVMMGIPSVLVGLFVYMLMVATMGHFSGLSASVALAIIMFPVIMRTTEDMLLMIPYTLRESALALGMTKTRTTLAVVCRSAKNGLLTGILLALSRVSGETAPLLFTALFSDSWPTGYFSEPTANLPVLITEYATNSPFESMQRAGWGAALVVTILVLCSNLGVRIFFREKKSGQ